MSNENEPVYLILRQLLLHALIAGCSCDDVILILDDAHALDALELHYFIRDCGVFFPRASKPRDQSITDERRRQLFELSISDD
jgi:hypothetical protein